MVSCCIKNRIAFMFVLVLSICVMFFPGLFTVRKLFYAWKKCGYMKRNVSNNIKKGIGSPF